MHLRLIIIVTSVVFSVGMIAPPRSRTPRKPAPAQPVDARPLERPKPLCSIRGEQVRQALQVVVSVLQAEGFSIEQTNWDTGEVLAKRASKNGEDQVLAWLEWDITRPGKRLNLFLSCGRYEKFFGANEFKRIELNNDEEQRHFGHLRQRLINEALRRG